MEEWREQLRTEAEQNAERDIERTKQFLAEKVEKIKKTLQLKMKVIEALREEPYLMFGETDIYVRTENHELVHDVVKALGLKLKRTAQADGFNFNGELDGIRICVYGMSEVPHCKIVPKTEMQKVTIYEVVCNEKEEKQE